MTVLDSLPLRYAYYPGCVAQGACRELYEATDLITRHLGIELIELAQASCCGSGTFKEESQLLEDSVNARNLALAEALKLPILTHCSTCQGVLGRVNQKLKQDIEANPTYVAHINQLCQSSGCKHTYQGTGEVKHLLWILIQDVGIEALAAKVQNTLSTLRCAPFYGCYLLRAYDISAYDHPVNPTSLEQIITAVGATPVDYPGRTQCCGWPISSYAPDQSFAMAGRHISAAIDAGADCMVTPCPLCHLNLDSRQPEVEAVMGRSLKLPILHLPQLIGLALGISPQALGLQRHIVSTQTIIEKVATTIKSP